jgi:hypothetical protein
LPHFTLNLDNSGPIVTALVLVSEARRAALTQNNVAIPAPKVIRALVDTGAGFTSIEPQVLTDLGLTPTGSVEYVTPSTGQGVATADTYDIDFLVHKNADEVPLILTNLNVAACELFNRQGIHALIGRDILSKCILIYNGEHAMFTLSF